MGQYLLFLAIQPVPKFLAHAQLLLNQFINLIVLLIKFISIVAVVIYPNVHGLPYTIAHRGESIAISGRRFASVVCRVTVTDHSRERFEFGDSSIDFAYGFGQLVPHHSGLIEHVLFLLVFEEVLDFRDVDLLEFIIFLFLYGSARTMRVHINFNCRMLGPAAIQYLIAQIDFLQTHALQTKSPNILLPFLLNYVFFEFLARFGRLKRFLVLDLMPVLVQFFRQWIDYLHIEL